MNEVILDPRQSTLSFEISHFNHHYPQVYSCVENVKIPRRIGNLIHNTCTNELTDARLYSISTFSWKYPTLFNQLNSMYLWVLWFERLNKYIKDDTELRTNEW